MIKLTKQLLPFKRFGVALSGGIDSIAVAHFLKKGNKDFTAVHVNAKYILQDDEAAEKVRMFCKDYGIELVLKEVEGKYEGGSVEAWCREKRYEVLKGVCRQEDLEQLVVCHHLDDCVESYLMNCFNGVPEYVPIPFRTSWGDVEVVRPFLLTGKEDFRGYVERHGLMRYVTEDELNQDMSLQRNWVRGCLRPLIETRYVGLSKVVKKKILNKLFVLSCPKRSKKVGA